jgi:hypothetical protein
MRGKFHRITPVQNTMLTMPNLYTVLTVSDHPSAGIRKKYPLIESPNRK